jgi:transcriptional regulator with XRE-family HTH domain
MNAMQTGTSTIGDKVRQMREAQGWTQDQLASQAQIDQADISKIERGVRQVGIRYARKLGKALSTSYRDFLPD